MQLENKDQQIQDKDQQIRDKDQQIQDKDQQIQDKDQQVQLYQQQMNDPVVYNTSIILSVDVNSSHNCSFSTTAPGEGRKFATFASAGLLTAHVVCFLFLSHSY